MRWVFAKLYCSCFSFDCLPQCVKGFLCVFLYMLACSYVFVVYRQLNIIAIMFNLTVFVSVLQGRDYHWLSTQNETSEKYDVLKSKSEGCSKRIINGVVSYFF